MGKTRIPGVSEILKKVGLSKDYLGIDPFYAQRGIATHKAIELHLKGILDPCSLDPVVVPHFGAFLKFWGNRKEEIIYDWKCSKSHDRVAELQGQAYKILAVQNGLGTTYNIDAIVGLPFIVVELRDDGTFMDFDYGKDYEQWSSVLDLYRWRMKRKGESK